MELKEVLGVENTVSDRLQNQMNQLENLVADHLLQILLSLSKNDWNMQEHKRRNWKDDYEAFVEHEVMQHELDLFVDSFADRVKMKMREKEQG